MRRNPMTVERLKSLLSQWASTLSGESLRDAQALLNAIGADPSFAEHFTTAVNAKLEKREAKKAAAKAAKEAEEQAAKAQEAAQVPSAGTGPMSDREAWTTLASLVDTNLPDLTQDEREALKAAFLDEARKAA